MVLSSSFDYLFLMVFTMPDDGKLDTESDSGEFWVLFGGFAPIGKKVTSEDDIIPEATPAKLYRYFIPSSSLCKSEAFSSKLSSFYISLFFYFYIMISHSSMW